MRLTKLTATLFATTIIASMVMVPEAGYGAEQAARRVQAQRQRDAMEHQAAEAASAKTKDAFYDPGAALANGTEIDTALRAASLDAASGAHGVIGHPIPAGTIAEKINAAQAIEGGGAGDAAHKAALRHALGLKSDAAALLPGSEQSGIVRRFIEISNEELVLVPAVGHAFAGLGAGGAIAQLNAILARLNAATHDATTGVALAGPPPAAANIAAALARAGL